MLNEKQLHTLRTCYAANPRPDALMKEQLVEMTGLSPRVIRVWFQNKRCKDKKKSILMKQLQQQQHNDKTVRELPLAELGSWASGLEYRNGPALCWVGSRESPQDHRVTGLRKRSAPLRETFLRLRLTKILRSGLLVPSGQGVQSP